MKVKKASRTDFGAQVVSIDFNKLGTYRIIWVSDLHGDGKNTNFDFLEKILKKYPDSKIFVGGDHLDVMQNYGDPRASKSALDSKFKKDNYLNEIIEYNLEKWDKYADRIISFFIGNHELTQIRKHGLDITEEIVKRLNEKHKTNILLGDLQGWIKLRFAYFGAIHVKNIFYQHIPESGGKRSKGMLSVDIIKGKYPDADIYIGEHIHDTWLKPERVEHLTDKGLVKYKNKWVIQMPTLKDEHSKMKRRGYVHVKNYGNVPLGIVVFDVDVEHRDVNITPRYELIN